MRSLLISLGCFLTKKIENNQQGQFADILKLSGAERRAILQKLFARERFDSQLSERLKSRLQTVTRELGGITSEQVGMGDCSKEAI